VCGICRSHYDGWVPVANSVQEMLLGATASLLVTRLACNRSGLQSCLFVTPFCP
jgi:hypothetical protein